MDIFGHKINAEAESNERKYSLSDFYYIVSYSKEKHAAVPMLSFKESYKYS